MARPLCLQLAALWSNSLLFQLLFVMKAVPGLRCEAAQQFQHSLLFDKVLEDLWPATLLYGQSTVKSSWLLPAPDMVSAVGHSV